METATVGGVIGTIVAVLLLACSPLILYAVSKWIERKKRRGDSDGDDA